ncbi:MAG: xylulose kinase [Planctomycetota bacterium]|jgi:xylulokinase
MAGRVGQGRHWAIALRLDLHLQRWHKRPITMPASAPALCLGMSVAPTHLALALVDQAGHVVAELTRAHGEPVDSDPADWWRACRTGVKDLLRRAGVGAERIRAIGVSGDSSVLVPTDRNGKALCPVTFGTDPRVAPAIDELAGSVGLRNLANLTGRLPGLASPLTKVLAVRSGAKRAWHDAVVLLPAKDWLRLRLTGQAATDACDAAATLLFNPRTRSWSKQVLTAAGIDAGLLPQVAAGDALAGRVTETAGRETGLQAGTPVVVGAGHAAAVAIAAGAAPGTLVVEIGGGGAIALPVAEPGKAALLMPGCHALDGALRSGLGLDCGAALAWTLDRLAPTELAQARRNGRELVDLAAEFAAEVATGAEDLLWLPERDQRGAQLGALHGLQPRHHRGHLARACLEGGALLAREALVESGAAALVAVGPGTATPFCVQLLADACDRPVQPLPVPHPAAVAGALLATTAVGIHKTVADATAKMVHRKVAVAPRRLAADVHSRQAAAVAALRRPPEPVAAEATA